MSKVQPKSPTILVIFGATGDLMQRKLTPALFNLHKKKLLPPLFQIVGFSRDKKTDKEFQDWVAGVIKKKDKRATTKQISEFTKRLTYKQGLFDTKEGYKRLGNTLGHWDSKWHTCANKLFYLAIPPIYYETVFKHLSASGLTDPCSAEEGWTRVIVEKPFGSDLKTAQNLDKLLGKSFKEEQIYRIDHYLGKETVRNVIAFRFSNSFLEPAWDNKSVEKIEIRLMEKLGVKNRGEFYDGIGALRDVGQSHLLQLLALFAMENPVTFNTSSIRERRAEILKQLKILTAQKVKEGTIRGQYKGYKNVKGVASKSTTETYFKIKAELDTARWRGVPIYLESGKQTGEKKAEVVMTFNHLNPCMCGPGGHKKNILRYEIGPHEQITTSFWVKRPGVNMILEEQEFHFDYDETFKHDEELAPYEKLYIDAITGNQTLFVSTPEVEANWRFVDPIMRVWRKGAPKLLTYDNAPPTDTLTVSKKSKTIHSEVTIIGLGKMGKNIALRLHEKGWKVYVFDRNASVVQKLARKGMHGLKSMNELRDATKSTRLVWVMVPAGVVDKVLFGKKGLENIVTRNDIIIDGGNSLYEHTLKRAARLKKKGIRFIDVGVSGGPNGARNGASLMIGGDKKTVTELNNLFENLAVKNGYAHVGKIGAGHFVKMVHNGIEYGMMQAIAEGFAIMKKSNLPDSLKEIAHVYNHGSVIESNLMGWMYDAFNKYGENLKGVSKTAIGTGERKWTTQVAHKLGIADDVIHQAFLARKRSEVTPNYQAQIIMALRNQFGGHDIHPNKGRVKPKKSKKK